MWKTGIPMRLATIADSELLVSPSSSSRSGRCVESTFSLSTRIFAICSANVSLRTPSTWSGARTPSWSKKTPARLWS